MTKMFYGFRTNEPEIVMHFHGKKCKIRVECDFDDEYFAYGRVEDAKVTVVETDEPLTSITNNRAAYVWGWCPIFRQDTAYPVSDDGRPYTFICTIDNSWGDSGTNNVFALINMSSTGYEVEDVYVESSCS